MNIDKINLSEKFGKLPDGDYAVGIIAKMNNYEIKVVKRTGESKSSFVLHKHEDTDETFIVLEGTMVMNYSDRAVEVNKGEMIVVPKGVEHQPSTITGYKVLLIELENTLNTGNIINEKTIRKIEWV
jgi:mannose-6-phosphate isomerase-like protein (cupin superfamily)